MQKSKYVLQKHNAKRAGLHYDLRIQYPDKDKLKSWAIKTPPPQQKGDKILAIKTTDHDPKWLTFEGEITSKYGKGIVEIEDENTVTLKKWKPKVITFTIPSGKYQGTYTLLNVDFKNEKPDSKKWLLFRSS